MMNIGRVCVKLAGRDAGKTCVIVNTIDENFVVIDGATRRRKCNIKHLEPTERVVEISQDASSEEVAAALGIDKIAKTEKHKTEKPTQKRKVKSPAAADLPAKPAKAAKIAKPKAKKSAE